MSEGSAATERAPSDEIAAVLREHAPHLADHWDATMRLYRTPDYLRARAAELDWKRTEPTVDSVAEDVTEQANGRFHSDPTFHSIVTVAERAARDRLEAEGMRATPSYKVAIRMGAITALFLGDVPSSTERNLVRDVLEAVADRDGISLDSDADPGKPARNYELALRLGIGKVFGLADLPDSEPKDPDRSVRSESD